MLNLISKEINRPERINIEFSDVWRNKNFRQALQRAYNKKLKTNKENYPPIFICCLGESNKRKICFYSEFVKLSLDHGVTQDEINRITNDNFNRYYLDMKQLGKNILPPTLIILYEKERSFYTFINQDHIQLAKNNA